LPPPTSCGRPLHLRAVPTRRSSELLQNHIAQHGGIEIERLYEPLFTTLHAESVDGIFPEAGTVDELLAILSAFEPKRATPSDRPAASQNSELQSRENLVCRLLLEKK